MSDFEYAIIGGGIHGTHIANKLVNDGGLDTSQLAVFDPEGYGEVFDQRTSDLGTDYLRSPEVHHTGRDPFDLKSYAEARNRREELTSDSGNPLRPSTSLFMDHLDYVVDSNNLEKSLIEEYVTDLREEDKLVLETDDDTYTAENGVLAIGNGKPNYPDFAGQVSESAPVSHIFDSGFSSEDAQRYDGETVIVGGSITAGQLSGLLSRKCDGGVTMMSRSPIELELVEAEP
jgi:glycine/D-amino acid oxidase-like deaminating enzyme